MRVYVKNDGVKNDVVNTGYEADMQRQCGMPLRRSTYDIRLKTGWPGAEIRKT